MRRSLVFVALIVFYLLHQDFWFWDDGRLIVGLPVGYLYHILYCVAACGLMFIVTLVLPLKGKPPTPEETRGGASLEDATTDEPERTSL